jgi:DNA-binding XRE family transcriptional regulator
MLTKNLNYLRKKNKVSQQVLADVLGVARTTLGDYERGKTEPNIETLINIATYFNVKVDDLLRSNLSHQDLEILRNKDMRVLAISVDQENRQNIELVDRKAEAGYLESFQDPEYISELPKLYFPQIPEGTYRAFEIQGNSMLPLLPGSIVICGYVENIDALKNDRTYVIATREGIVYKRIFNNINDHTITAISDNPAYPPYIIPWEDIAEIWQYYAHVSFSDIKKGMDQWLESNIGEIQRKLDEIIEQ